MLKNFVEYKRFVWELNNYIDVNKNVIFLCIGTSSIIGDSFGPTVGSILKNKLKTNMSQVIGDLNNCVTYTEIHKKMIDINNQYSNKLIVVLDSALSNKSDIGKVFIQNRGLKYAESLKKNNKIIGDVSIKAVVGENSYDSFKNFYNLKNVSEQRIRLVSTIAANGIIEVMNKKENNGKNIYKLQPDF